MSLSCFDIATLEPEATMAIAVLTPSLGEGHSLIHTSTYTDNAKEVCVTRQSDYAPPCVVFVTKLAVAPYSKFMARENGTYYYFYNWMEALSLYGTCIHALLMMLTPSLTGRRTTDDRGSSRTF